LLEDGSISVYVLYPIEVVIYDTDFIHAKHIFYL
jgi:hypothetical protein